MLETLNTPCKGSYDVIVCGGGVAGAAAAVAARRTGASVLLLEKNVTLGGLATIGLISWFEPLCNGEGWRPMNGMPLELLKLALQNGFGTLPEAWKDYPERSEERGRCASFFSPTIFAMALDSWLLDSGVELLLDTVVARPVTDGRKILGVAVENKDGRGYYEGKTVVDATGDGDVLFGCGLPMEAGKNYLTYIAYRTDVDACRKAAEQGDMRLSRSWVNVGADLWGGHQPENAPLYEGISARNVTDLMVRGRALLMDSLSQTPPSERDIASLPGMPQFRMTRRLKGAFELRQEHCGQRFEDSIGVACDFYRRGECYELPLRILYSQQMENLLTAGRTVSSTGWAWEMTRVIPVAIATGQAAGVAAALLAKRGEAIQGLPVEEVQGRLSEEGVRLHLPMKDEGR